MYGDPAQIRALARAMSDQATQVRTWAQQLDSQAESTQWRSLAGSAMRRKMRTRKALLRRCAQVHEDAAQDLLAHAREVEQRMAAIATIARRFERARDELGGLVERGAEAVDRIVPGSFEDALSRFEPPPPGDRRWLEVPDLLPGI